MSHEGLRRDLEFVWSAETSASPDQWTADRPSLGQCAVTALLVQDRYDGELLRSTVGGVSHYWNRLPDGTEVDLTRDQFDDPTLDDLPIVRERSYVLSQPETADRYEKLRVALGEHWFDT